MTETNVEDAVRCECRIGSCCLQCLRCEGTGKVVGGKCSVCKGDANRCLNTDAAELPFGVGGIRVDFAVCLACNGNYQPGKVGWVELEARALDAMVAAGQQRMSGFEPP